MKKLLFLLIIIITSCQSQSPQDFNAIKINLENEYSSETAGIALAVVSDSTTIWSGAFGMANIALKEPMTINHTLNIASVSKVFVATAIMQLSDIWGHGGDDPGVQTGLYLDRENNRAMIMIKNSNLGSRTQMVKGLYEASMNRRK